MVAPSKNITVGTKQNITIVEVPALVLGIFPYPPREREGVWISHRQTKSGECSWPWIHPIPTPFFWVKANRRMGQKSISTSHLQLTTVLLGQSYGQTHNHKTIDIGTRLSREGSFSTLLTPLSYRSIDKGDATGFDYVAITLCGDFAATRSRR